MSKYAYLSKIDKQIILAKNCTANDINKVFYCPDPNCNCEVKLVSYNSNKRKAHFRGNNHSENCIFYHSNLNDINEFDVTNFSPSNLLDIITNAKNRTNDNNFKTDTDKVNNQSDKKYINTIKALYYLAINYPVSYEINGYKISDLVCYKNTAHIYTKFISGIKLVVCDFYYYNTDSNTIYFRYNNSIILKAVFDTSELFKKAQKDFYEKENVIIFANWDSSGVYSTANISNYKQLNIISGRDSSN